jgi:hypothetical protein
MVAVILPFVLLAWSEPLRELRNGPWHRNWSELASYRKAITADVRRNDTGFQVATSL